ncbi:hypothetical protein ACGYLI_04825 [Sulfitobacter sp. 1A13421]|uniref:hypothetical protein n=1 Tax=Sulfitobacter sp. 1A13421 TaxID=3368595 RepID=UPI003745FE4C
MMNMGRRIPMRRPFSWPITDRDADKNDGSKYQGRFWMGQGKDPVSQAKNKPD